jgi:hypothetical protein
MVMLLVGPGSSFWLSAPPKLCDERRAREQRDHANRNRRSIAPLSMKAARRFM